MRQFHIGAADALRRAAGASVWRINRKVHDRIIDETRAQLAPDAFDAAWAEGGALSLDQAIGLALRVAAPA